MRKNPTVIREDVYGPSLRWRSELINEELIAAAATLLSHVRALILDYAAYDTKVTKGHCPLKKTSATKLSTRPAAVGSSSSAVARSAVSTDVPTVGSGSTAGHTLGSPATTTVSVESVGIDLKVNVGSNTMSGSATPSSSSAAQLQQQSIAQRLSALLTVPHRWVKAKGSGEMVARQSVVVTLAYILERRAAAEAKAAAVAAATAAKKAEKEAKRDAKEAELKRKKESREQKKLGKEKAKQDREEQRLQARTSKPKRGRKRKAEFDHPDSSDSTDVSKIDIVCASDAVLAKLLSGDSDDSDKDL